MGSMFSSSKGWTFLFQEQQIHETTKGQNRVALIELMEQRNGVAQCGIMKAMATCFTLHSLCELLMPMRSSKPGKNILPTYKPLPFSDYFPWEYHDWGKLHLMIISLRLHRICNATLESQCFALQVIGKYTDFSGHC